jgi:uncharacterized protein (DUF1501 family)
MRRRDFMKSAASASLLLAAPFGHRSFKAQAQGMPDDTLWFFFDAAGGWDNTALMDPKGGEPHSAFYGESHIGTVGGIRYAPKDVVADVQDFFQRYGNSLLVVNGIDTQTNSHDVGPRHVWSGNIRTGTPSLGSLMAAIYEHEAGLTLPMAMLSSGGYDYTDGLIPPGRVGDPNTLIDISLPYRVNPRDESSLDRFLPPEVEVQIRAKQALRSARMQDGNVLPYIRKVMQDLDRARSAEVGFGAIQSEFANLPALTTEENANPLIPKARVAVSAMKAGVCLAANLSTGGFDTHVDHDNLHRDRLQLYLDAVDWTARTLENLGLLNRAVFVMASDFSRTTYNLDVDQPGRGKDHWPITSVMMMGRGIAGGRVVGETDDGSNGDGTYENGVRAKKVKVQGGELVTTGDTDAEGFILRPGHIHDALRELAGFRNHQISEKYPIEDAQASVLPLLNG